MPASTRGRIPAKDRAFDYVKQQVLTGALAGGQLISEGEIAGALGMSRTPVREAFLRLEAEGLLRLYPQRGALVVPVSTEEMRAVMEARVVLEEFAAGKVARQDQPARDAVFARLAEQLRRQRAADPSELRDFLDADRSFHAILMAAADNPVLDNVYASLRDRQTRMIGESTVRGPQRITTIVDEHVRIAEAVHAGRIDQAQQAVRVHLASTARALGLVVDPPA